MQVQDVPKVIENIHWNNSIDKLKRNFLNTPIYLCILTHIAQTIFYSYIRPIVKKILEVSFIFQKKKKKSFGNRKGSITFPRGFPRDSHTREVGEVEARLPVTDHRGAATPPVGHVLPTRSGTSHALEPLLNARIGGAATTRGIARTWPPGGRE